AYYELDEALKPVEKEMPADLKHSVERIQENCEPALCTVLFMGGAGGSLRAGVTDNPVRLTRSVKEALTRVTSGGAPVYVWPGGPIDLIVEARGSEANVRAAYDAAVQRFTGLLDELCEELPLLRQAADPARCPLRGTVARRMHEAVAPFASEHFITPMAAVAGSVAEEILGAMLQKAQLERAYVNNGGDIALHLADGEHFTVGLAERPDAPALMRAMVVHVD